ncbi:MAG TPA: heavy metal translocating P-type ATPase [Candidatus Bathyarchaeia archaeon]|nr:heavy metal translocating P-type ATPase [Candidatus Bathyarchaeia archaeon]
MSKLEFKIRGMDCAEEVTTLKRQVGPVVGGEDRLDFNILAGKMTVQADSPEISIQAIQQAVRSAGLDAVVWEDFPPQQVGAQESSFLERHGRAVSCSASFALLALGFLIHAAAEGPVAAATAEDHNFPPASILFYAAAVVVGGWYIASRALKAAREFRPDMNLLMTVAVVGAIIIGQWLEAAMVTFLFALALLLETWSVNRARRAIGALLDLSPRKARYVWPRDGAVEEKPVEQFAAGDTVLVLAGDRVPLDGVITKGATSVNQAPITGESAPVAKQPGDEVYAGTINNEGAFEFRVTRAFNNTTLAHIIRMVEEAQARRSRSERWVERFARYYTPAMMGLAVLIAVVPPLFLAGAWRFWFYEALVLLVIACPCALVISTPVSIVAALASAARAGVLIKGGLYIEIPARLRAVAIDKTGTLTRGRPEVQRVVPLNGHTPEELLERAAAVESLSEHPLAQAILRRARADGVAFGRADSYHSLKGKGAEARVGGVKYWIGSHRYAHEIGTDDPATHAYAEALEDAGHSVVFIGNDRHVCGLISIADQVHPKAAQAVRAIKAAGIEHVVMLTGDNEGTARAVADAVGLDEYRAELLPEDKVTAVRVLVERYGYVAMVGDGVNDAPAMAESALGIAMGAAGSDAAIETADVALMSDDLTKVGWLITHSRRTVRVIKQNVTLALGIKAVFIALAMTGLATLWMAIAADMGASLLVIFNGLRLLDGNEK